jgi:hypothetical protein
MVHTAHNIPMLRRVRVGKESKTLVIDWKGGGSDTVDLTGLIARRAVFAPLEDAAEFATVHLVDRGMGIEWDCGLDYSGTNLKRIAEEQRPMTAAEFAVFLVDADISPAEAAGLFNLTSRTIQNYRDGKTDVSVAVASTVRAMLHDPTVLYARFRPARRGRPRKSA